MIFKYIKGKNEKLIEYENKSVMDYYDFIKKYFSMIKVYNCEISIGLFWTNILTGEKSESKIPIQNELRLPICNGYTCYVYCSVLRDGKVVEVASDDGETDYYTLSECWQISSIHGILFHGINVDLFDQNLQEVKIDIEHFLECLEKDKK